MSGAVTKAPALYELAGMRDILDQWLEESEGELTPELEQLLGELEGKVEEKVERVALWIREQLALAEGIKTEEQRLAARRKARENAADRMKRYLEAQLERLGKDKVQGLLCTVALQNNPRSIVGDLSEEQIRNLAMIPEWTPCVRHIPERFELDRRAVVKVVDAGHPLPDGLEVVQNRSLRIR